MLTAVLIAAIVCAVSSVATMVLAIAYAANRQKEEKALEDYAESLTEAFREESLAFRVKMAEIPTPAVAIGQNIDHAMSIQERTIASLSDSFVRVRDELRGCMADVQARLIRTELDKISNGYKIKDRQRKHLVKHKPPSTPVPKPSSKTPAASLVAVKR